MDLFASLLAQRGRVRSVEYSSFPAYRDLIKAGLVEETGVVSSVICDECNQPHDSEIVYEGSQYGFYCPDFGFVSKARSELIATQPNLSEFVAKIADHLNCRRRKSTPLEGQTWRVGALDTHQGAVVVYVTPKMQEAQDVNGFQSATSSELKSPFGIVLTSIGTLSVAPYNTVQIRDIIDLEPETGKLIVVADLQAIAGVPKERNGGRRNEYSKPLSELSAIRVKEKRTLKGRNEEAKALRAEYKVQFPNQKIPSQSVVNKFVTKFRGGS